MKWGSELGPAVLEGFALPKTYAKLAPNVSLSIPTNLLFNAAPRAAYQAGAYDGFYSYAELLKQGDFGLGATDRNGGELLLLNGDVYRSRVPAKKSNVRYPDRRRFHIC